MIVLFYLGALMVLIWEANSFSDPKFTQKQEIDEGLSEDDKLALKDLDPKAISKILSGCLIVIFQLLYWAWNVAGFFTFQWPFFLVLFILGFIPKKAIWWIQLDAFISLVLVLFIVLNQAHFKIHLF